MAEAVFMPRLGQSVETCIITEWVKKKGDKVEEGEVLFCYETDKAAFEETAKTAGILLDVFYDEGDEVPVLANVAVIGKPGESTEEFRSSSSAGPAEPAVATSKEEVSEPPAPAPDPLSELTGKIRISPRARNMAESKAISINGIQGSGPNGRIIVRDIEKAMSVSPVEEASVTKASVAPPINQQVISSQDDFEIKPLTNIRKLIAKGMHASLQNSAQLTHHLSADARKILALREDVKKRALSEDIPNVTLNDMICYAAIRALEKYPAANSHFLGDSIKTFRKVHLGIAVDTERGLMVPVIKNADELNLKTLSVKIKSLADECRKGTVNPDLLKAEEASFTISNLGAFGIEMFTPVINLPQSAILGVNTIIQRPADLGGGAFGFIPVLGLSLTYDHRSLDGAPASAFLREIKLQVENFGNQLI